MKTNNYTLVYSNYDEDTGVSTVKINTDIGVFTGSAKCHPDEEIKSKYYGCQLAEGRAILAYLKNLVKIGKAQRDALFNLNTTVCQLRDYQKDNIYTSKIRRAMYEKQEWIDKREEEIYKLQLRIATLQHEREAAMRQIYGGKEK